MRPSFLALLFALPLAVFPGNIVSAQTSASAAIPYKTFHLKGIINAPNVNKAPVEIWFRAPDNFRSVTQMMGQKMVAIMSGQDLYTYADGTQMGMRFNRSALPAQARDADPSQLFGQVALWKKTGKKIGSESVNSRPCDVYAIPENGGKVWLWTANDFPLRTILTTAGNTSEMTVTDIEMNPQLVAGLFVPPAEVQFQDLGALLKNMPNMDQLKKALGQ